MYTFRVSQFRTKIERLFDGGVSVYSNSIYYYIRDYIFMSIYPENGNGVGPIIS